MSRIKVLSPDVRRKIAAGEVILRPVSVVKELIENSLDAHAMQIDTDITNGGIQKMLVNDNGIGMDRDDAVHATERFTTSKITDIGDIERISTYGFRGEALTSIAQVSHFDLETSDGVKGTRIEIIGGEVKRTFESQRPRGTRIKVSNLFFNLPARFKFLKSAAWERRLVAEIVKTYALICPSVSFALAEAGRSLIDLSSVDSIEKRLKMVFPQSLMDSLIPVDVEISRVQIHGFFSRPDFFEPHHMHYIYVNSRPVRYPRVYRMISAAYQNPKNPPAYILNIVVEPKLVDVNIHPTKSEVKFKDEKYVLDLLVQLLKKKIYAKPIAVDYKAAELGLGKGEHTQHDTRFVQEKVIPYAPEERTERAVDKDPEEFWQIHNTYIISQTKSGLIIVDQHVAHERIIYESILKRKHGTQRLLFPITLDLTPEEYRIYKKTKLLLQELGVEFKEFSSRTIVIDSLPTDAKVGREDLVDIFKEIDGLGNLMKNKEEVAKVIACRSAIKAGQKLSANEMQSLVDNLFACENPYTCPHGRPVVIRLTLEELATRFGRE